MSDAAKIFTLAEARALLPQVKQLMQQVQDARQEILRLRPEIWPVLRKAAGNGGSTRTNEMLLQFHQVETGVKGITALGVLVKDIDMGLVDFLSTYQGRTVLLCWRHGEQNIGFWHDLNSGFASRQPIDENPDES